MSELHPEVTRIKGRSDSFWRTFELIFDSFRLEIVLRGNEPDEISIFSSNKDVENRSHFVQECSVAEAAKLGELAPSIHGYRELDEFLRAHYTDLSGYYSGRTRAHEG
jgi:hypothetical protein